LSLQKWAFRNKKRARCEATGPSTICRAFKGLSLAGKLAS
jgi:hypothetical protein